MRGSWSRPGSATRRAASARSLHRTEPAGAVRRRTVARRRPADLRRDGPRRQRRRAARHRRDRASARRPRSSPRIAARARGALPSARSAGRRRRRGRCGGSRASTSARARGSPRSPRTSGSRSPCRRPSSAAPVCPTVRDNDAACAALGQFWVGPDAGDRRLRDALHVERASASGLITGGSLARGSSSNVGEIGHMVLDIDGPGVLVRIARMPRDSSPRRGRSSRRRWPTLTSPQDSSLSRRGAATPSRLRRDRARGGPRGRAQPRADRAIRALRGGGHALGRQCARPRPHLPRGARVSPRPAPSTCATSGMPSAATRPHPRGARRHGRAVRSRAGCGGDRRSIPRPAARPDSAHACRPGVTPARVGALNARCARPRASDTSQLR